MQVLLNLMSNAVKFTDKGSICLRCKTKVIQSREMLCISVKDTGVGIKPEEISKLFQEFAMLDSNRALNPNGTGLGLFLSRKLAQLMEGDIYVKSTYTKGSKFTLAFPFEFDEGAEDSKMASSALSTPALKPANPCPIEIPNSNSVSVLVADDSEMNLHVLSSMLKKLNVQCEKAKNGAEVVACVEARAAAPVGPRSYSLILMDINMPIMTGLEVDFKAT